MLFNTVTLIIPSVYHAQLQWFLSLNAKYLQSCNFIVVTSSPDFSPAFAKKYLSHIKIIKIDRPLGFAKTVNLGLKAATTEWVATCNDDVILSEGWAEQLLAVATDQTGGLNPVIKAADGSVESAGIALLPIGKAQPLTHTIPEQPFATEALNAACVIYRKAALEQAGYFDERFGSYLEDIDLSLTLHKLGWEQLVVPAVSITHQRQQTSTKVLGWKKSFYDARNWWLILFKHWSISLWIKHLPGIVLERARNCSGLVKALLQK